MPTDSPGVLIAFSQETPVPPSRHAGGPRRWTPVPFFVAVQQHVPPDRIAEVLAAIRGDFATSRHVHPGRRTTRIFRHDHEPKILAIGEWERQEDYERLRLSPGYQATSARADPPARIDYLRPLRFTGHMHLRPTVVGAATVTSTEATCEAVVDFLITSVRAEMVALPGLVTHELYRVRDDPCRLLALHSWVSMEALQQYRCCMSPRHEVELAAFGATFERFVGTLAAEYSHLQPPAP